jgi:hypothetical protein
LGSLPSQLACMVSGLHCVSAAPVLGQLFQLLLHQYMDQLCGSNLRGSRRRSEGWAGLLLLLTAAATAAPADSSCDCCSC